MTEQSIPEVVQSLVEIDHKVCVNCGKDKPLTAFRFKGLKPTERKQMCVVCETLRQSKGYKSRKTAGRM